MRRRLPCMLKGEGSMRIDQLIPKRLLYQHMKEPPSCTDRDTFDKWLTASRATDRAGNIEPAVRECGFCADCTRDHQHKMVGAGRCDHFIDIEFKDGEAHLKGYRERLHIADRIICRELGL